MKPDLPEILAVQFQRLRSRIRAVSAAGGIGLTLCVVASLIGLAIISDILIELPFMLRAGMLLLTGTLSCLGLVFWVLRPATKRVQDEELAAFVEKQFPELNERLISTVEFQQEPDSSASPVMKKWLLQETVNYSKKVDFSDAVDASRAVRHCWWGGIACLALILPLLVVGDAYAVLFSRFVNPWGNYERVQNLILVVEEGDRVVAEKSDVTIEAKVRWRFQEGTIPESAWLEWTTDTGVTDARRLDWNAETESFIGTLSRVESSFSYHVAAKRSQTQSYRIDVVPLPKIEELQIEISPPAYTGQPAQFHDLALGEIMVIEQSNWDISARFNKPVEAAEILWLDGELTGKDKLASDSLADGTPIIAKTDFPLRGDRMSATLNEVLTLESPSGRFAIRATDENGLSSETNIIRRLTIIADTAPLIQFADHEQNVAVKPDDIIDLPVTVTDDFGIETLELHYEIKRSEAFTEKGIIKAEGFHSGHQQLAHIFRVDLSPLKMEAGMLLSLRGRATDERPVPEPNEAWTVTRTLIINKDAKPYGDQTLSEQQQQTEQVLEALKTELQKQKEKAKQLEETAKEANDKQEQWEDAADEQELLDKLEKLKQQMERLSALFEQQPLFEKVAQETRDIAEGNLQDAAEAVQQAQEADLSQKPEEFAKAAEQLEEAANQLGETHEKFDQLAELQRDLLELNRLANQTERLAESVESLENRQEEMQAKPEQAAPTPQDQAEKQQWEADQRQAWNNHEDLSNTLDDLFQRRPELADAAAENLQKQLEELAKRAEQLAEKQQNLANAAKADAQEIAEQLESLQKESDPEKMEAAANSLAENLEAPQQKQAIQAAQESLKKSQEAAQKGDAATAAQQQMEAKQQLDQLAQQLQQEVQKAPTNEANKAALESLTENVQAAEQLSQQLEESIAKIEEALPGTIEAAQQQDTSAEQAGEKSPSGEANHESPTSAIDGNSLTEQQEQVAELAQQVQYQISEMTQPNEEVSQKSQQFAEQAKQSAESAQQIQPAAAANSSQQAAQAAQELSEALQKTDAPDSLKQAAQQAADQQTQLANSMQEFSENKAAQQQMKSNLQQEISNETQKLAQDLQQNSEQLSAQPINKQDQSAKSQQAQKSAQQAQQQMSQATEQSQQNNQGQSQVASEQAAKSLSEAAQQALAASGQAGDKSDSESNEPGSAVPAEVGEQVAQAAQQLSAAGEMLNQMGTPVPGSQQPGEEESGDQSDSQKQAMDGGEGEGQQQGQQPKSGQKSTSEALRQAAQSMRQAAGQMAAGQSKPQLGNSQQKPQQSSNGSGSEASDFGSSQQLSDLLDLQSDLSNMTKRDWGQLPGELQTELLDSSHKRTSGEYSRLVRRYFNDISKKRSPELNKSE